MEDQKLTVGDEATITWKDLADGSKLFTITYTDGKGTYVCLKKEEFEGLEIHDLLEVIMPCKDEKETAAGSFKVKGK